MMQTRSALTGFALLLGGLLQTGTAQAFFFGDMMNPSRWFGGNDRDYYDDYYDGPRGPGYGGPGYYGPPGAYGAPGYAPPVYAAPGYAAPAYGHAPPAVQTTPTTGDSASEREIERLRDRIEQLEQERAAATAYPVDSYAPPAYAPPAADAGAYPAPAPPAGDMAGYSSTSAAPPVQQGMSQPDQSQAPSAGEWRPSGYYHPAMQ